MCAILDPDDDIVEPATLPMVPMDASRGADSGEAPDNWRAALIRAAVELAGRPPLQPVTRLICGYGERRSR